MARYIHNFKKTVWGYLYVDAPSKKKAQELLDKGDFDEYENKSDMEFEGELSRG